MNRILPIAIALLTACSIEPTPEPEPRSAPLQLDQPGDRTIAGTYHSHDELLTSHIERTGDDALTAQVHDDDGNMLTADSTQPSIALRGIDLTQADIGFIIADPRAQLSNTVWQQLDDLHAALAGC